MKTGLWKLNESEQATTGRDKQKPLSSILQPESGTTTKTEVPPLRTPMTYEESTKLGMEYSALAFAGRYREAIPIAKTLLADSEKKYGYANAITASYVYNLAIIYTALGQYEQAERLHQRALEAWEKSQDRLAPAQKQPLFAHSLGGLADVYIAKGELTKAEPLLKRKLALYKRIARYGEQFGGSIDEQLVGYGIHSLAKLYQAQGRLDEAEAYYKLAIASFEINIEKQENMAVLQERYGYKAFGKTLVRSAQETFTRVLTDLAGLYRLQSRFSEARGLLDRSTEIIRRYGGENSPGFAENRQTLAKVEEGQGRLEKAKRLYKRALSLEESFVGRAHPNVAEILDNLSTVFRKEKRYEEALNYSRRATAIHRDRAARLGTQRSYAALVEQRKAREIFMNHVQSAWALSKRQPRNVEALAAEAFESGQLAQASSAAVAVANMAARFGAGDDAMAGIVRARQDAVEERTQTDRVFVDMLGRPPEQRNRAAEDRLRGEIAALDRRITQLDERLSREFPEYVDLAMPRPVPVSKVKKLLGRNEALVVFLIGMKNSFIWVLRRDRAEMTRLPITAAELDEAVFDLRSSLDATRIQSVADIPDYPLTKAYELYRKLLAPAEQLLESARHVFVVPGGALQSLPLGVLVTEKPKGEVTDFPGYRKVPWLAKRFALTVLPSVSSLSALRRLASKARARRPFVGFGDPALKGHPGDRRGLKVATLFTRGRGGLADPRQVRELGALPDTADELRALAASLGAGQESIFLADKATETAVKGMNLSDVQVLAFATHALMAGDFENLGEPALVLTPPDKASAQDDGLLTASEVAMLNLNADWVILSACNTAAADGTPGAQGLSGLAKAFFYAGSRALLVSHWPVLSDAAVKLTTRMLSKMASDPKIGRAEALRRSMLALMDDAEKPFYAHPMFWAPFIVVGEGGTATIN